jgi:hypothetical protein
MHFSQSNDQKDEESGYDEALVISRSGNIYNMALKSSTTIITNTTNSNNSKKKTHPNNNPVDALFMAIVEKFDLDSLSISISSASTSSSSLRRERNFPVGTAVQFSFANSNSNSSSSTEFEHNLLRILSSKKLLCENVQLQNAKLTKAVTVLQPQPGGAGAGAGQSKIIMLPNDAFSLCHSSTLMDKIISSAPCRDFIGVYSQVQSNLNQIDIVDRAAWISVVRDHVRDRDRGHGQDNTRTIIEKGLGFGRIVNHPDGVNVNLGRLLGGEVDATGTMPMPMQQHCPLTRSSKIITRDGYGNESVEHDLKSSAMDMQRDLLGSSLSLEGSHGREQGVGAENLFGIEKSVIRVDGMANEGTLQTRVYYKAGASAGAGGTCLEDSTDVSVVDVYPHEFISPIYHTLRISLVEGLGAGERKFVESCLFFLIFSFVTRTRMNTVQYDTCKPLSYSYI